MENVMAKNDLSLVEKFKSVEEKILKELKETDLKIDYTSDRKIVISSLKDYIRRVKSIEKILDEYEEISKKLEKLMEDEKKGVTEAVVELREDSDELKAEIAIINGQAVINQKKKKKSTEKLREF